MTISIKKAAVLLVSVFLSTLVTLHAYNISSDSSTYSSNSSNNQRLLQQQFTDYDDEEFDDESAYEQARNNVSTQESRELKSGNQHNEHVHTAHNHNHYHHNPQPTIPTVFIQQVEVGEVERSLSCPPGHDLIGEECINNELIRPDLICQPGYQNVDGKCYMYTRAKRECASGYNLSGGRCVTVNIVPVEYSCADGELDVSGESCIVTQDSGPICPPGYSMENDVCIQRFAPSLHCPSGHQHHKKGCMKSTEFDASLRCPEGSEMDPSGTKCYKMHHGTPRCPKGFHDVGGTGKCIRQVKRTWAQCPPGFNESHSHGHLCEKQIQVPPHLSCAMGSELDPVTGMCTSSLEMNVTCPKGYSQSNGVPGMCERIVPEVAACPPGTTAIGFGEAARCQSVVEHEMIECCPPGFDQIFGKCQRTELFAPVASCEDCTRVRHYKPKLICPEESYTVRGTMCVHTVAEPCPPQAESECAAFMHLLNDKPNGGQSLRSLEVADPSDYIPAHCLRNSQNVKGAKMCHREIVAPAEIQCGGKGYFDGKQCTEKYEIQAEPKCHVGLLDPSTGQCLKTSEVPMKTECVPGTTRIGNRCVQYEDHAPLFSCPEDAVLDRATGNCVTRLPAVVQSGELIRTPPVSLCASGTLSEGLCWDIERAPRQRICPANSVPDIKYSGEDAACVMYADFLIPPPHKKHVKPSYVCSDGSMAKSKSCHAHDFENPTPSCPSGSLLTENRRSCIREMRPISTSNRIMTSVPIPVCPHGTTAQGTKCVASKSVDAHLICPTGYFANHFGLDGRECQKTASLIPACPPGTMHTPDGCLKRVSLPPIVTHIPLPPHCEADKPCRF